MEQLRRETPKLILPDLWPPTSPDLNPVDNQIWHMMQDRVYQTPFRDVADLRQRFPIHHINFEWQPFCADVPLRNYTLTHSEAALDRHFEWLVGRKALWTVLLRKAYRVREIMPVCMKKKAILKITIILKAQEVQTVYVDRPLLDF